MENNKEYLEHLRHSCAHLLAKSVLELFPGTHNAIGPSIADGFYQDFDFGDKKITEEDLEKIEAKMRAVLKEWKDFQINEVPVEQAREDFKHNPYKLELLEEFANEGKTITETKQGDFLDLCKGGHLTNPQELKHFKLLSIAGAYWRGDEKNKMLTRIYGTAFPSKEELDTYLWQREEAKKRDHRKLGKQLDLFTFSELVGSGMPLYTPRGALIRRKLNEYVEELQSKEEYTQVWTPQIAKAELFKTSGHYHKYKDDMFRVVSNYSDEEFYLKPMNCPQHTQIYTSQSRSYKDLPIRLTDFAMLYRDEKPGELLGLARVRSFSQDDCHIFCREDQVDAEIDKALQMTKQIMETFGFKYKYRLSTRDKSQPEKYLGDPQIWDKVEKWAEEIMKRNKIEYFEGPGEAAFYAPKMDLMAIDSLGREWQLSTVQIDYVMPERFDLKYTDSDGQEKPPVMIHRAILGSAERMMMILLESFAGALPAWLSPEQVRIIPISDQNIAYAEKLGAQLKEHGVRFEIDMDSERMQKKVKVAQDLKIPYMLILGKKEEEENTVSLRLRSGEQINGIKFAEFLQKLVDNINVRSLEINSFN